MRAIDFSVMVLPTLTRYEVYAFGPTNTGRLYEEDLMTSCVHDRALCTSRWGPRLVSELVEPGVVAIGSDKFKGTTGRLGVGDEPSDG